MPAEQLDDGESVVLVADDPDIDGEVLTVAKGRTYHPVNDCRYLSYSDGRVRPMTVEIAETWGYDECDECRDRIDQAETVEA